MKHCSYCGEDKPLESFGRMKSSPDGVQRWCKACFKEYRVKNLDKRKAYIKAYYAEGGYGQAPHTPTPSYHGLHSRIKATYGAARKYACAAGCGRQAQDWSYNPGCAGEVLNEKEQLYYCYHVEHYEPLCRTCHLIKDHGAVVS